MAQQDAAVGMGLESPGSDEVRIEMDNLSVKISALNKVGEAHVDGNMASPGVPSDVRGAELPAGAGILETVLPRRPNDRSRSPSKCLYPMVQGDPWETLKDGVDKFDTELCKAWNGELDTILTFTGLFSAAVTAFCVQSLQFLSQSPADTTNIFLIALSQQLSNSSSPIAALSMVEGFTPTTPNVYINVLYFVSLTLALSVSSVCILGKQWIREYQKDISVSALDAVRVRQARFDSLEVWKVPEIMAALPVILLTALLLFFTGLLIQLWNVGEHTTAITVSIVVALTVFMVIVTTLVPAICSMQPRRAAFTPFRSPQAWIVFALYRRLQQWYHSIFDVYHKPPSSLADWSAFDVEFLKVEAEVWFEHEVGSVHQALRWVHEVLGNSSVMEKAVHWCFQKQFHPEKLVQSEGHLSRYVLGSDSDSGEHIDNPYRLCVDLSEKVDGWQHIDSAVGRYQAELLVRSAHHAIEQGKKHWDKIFHCYEKLQLCDIFEDYSQEDIVHHQHKIQDQAALLLERILEIPLPPDLSEWQDVICFLLKARRDSSSPLSRQVAHAVINQRLPTYIRENNSATLLYDIGRATCEWAWLSWEDGIVLFSQLDKVMVGMCEMLASVEDLNEEIVERWRELRAKFIEKTSKSAPQRLRLPNGHFDALHGRLPSLSSKSLLSSNSIESSEK